MVAQFIKGFRALHFLGPTVTVFGSARFHEGNAYYELAKKVSYDLAKRGFAIMTGGGPCIMETLNRGGGKGGKGPSPYGRILSAPIGDGDIPRAKIRSLRYPLVLDQPRVTTITVYPQKAKV